MEQQQVLKIRLSDDGLIALPEELRAARSWKPGQELEVVNAGDGILLRSSPSFPLTQLDEVAGRLAYDGPPISVEDMNGAVVLRRKAGSERP